jgi:hypothetical protein
MAIPKMENAVQLYNCIVTFIILFVQCNNHISSLKGVRCPTVGCSLHRYFIVFLDFFVFTLNTPHHNNNSKIYKESVNWFGLANGSSKKWRIFLADDGLGSQVFGSGIHHLYTEGET